MSDALVVSGEFAGARADAGLAGLLGISRSAAAALIAGGHVLSAGKPLGKSAKLVAGDVLQVNVPERRDPDAVQGLQDPDRWAAASRLSVERAAEFSWDESARQLVGTAAEIVARRRR